MDNNDLDSSGHSVRSRSGRRGSASSALSQGLNDNVGGDDTLNINDTSATSPIPPQVGSTTTRSRSPVPPGATRSSGRKKKKSRKFTHTKAKRSKNNIDSGTDDEDLNNSNSIAEEEKDKIKPLVLLGDKPRGLYECDYCGSDLTRTPRIRCAICPDFDLCLECFATEDHAHMAKYKRDEEAQRRKHAEQVAVELGEEVEAPPVKKKAGRPKAGTRNKKKDDHEELGSYVGGIWVPYFRHDPSHGYIVADSTRYSMFPSFRGVKSVETIELMDDDNNINDEGDGGNKKNNGSSGGDDIGEIGDVKEVEKSDGDDLNLQEDGTTDLIGDMKAKPEEGAEQENDSPTTTTPMDIDDGKAKEEEDGTIKQPPDDVASKSGDVMDLDEVATKKDDTGKQDASEGAPTASEAETPKKVVMDPLEFLASVAESSAQKEVKANQEGEMNIDKEVKADNDINMEMNEAAESKVDDKKEETAEPKTEGDMKADATEEIKTNTEDTIKTDTVKEIKVDNNITMGVPEGESKSEVEPKLEEQNDRQGDQGGQPNPDNAIIKEDETIADEKKEDENESSNKDTTSAAPEKDASGSSINSSTTNTEPPRFRVTDDPKNVWTVEEDLRLLDGILTCGLGNWPEIAEHINNGASGDGVGTSEGGGGSSGKSDKQCMERYLDDFMGRYGNILPPYTLVPDGEYEVVKKEEESKPAASDPLAIDSSDGEHAEGAGIAARKRPRRSLSSNVIEEDASAPGFKRTKFRVVPTEELDECKNLWPHPFVPTSTGAKFGEEVARDLWYRSEQQFIRQHHATSSKAEAAAFRKQFIERRAQKVPGYEAKVLPPRMEDCKQLPGKELAGYMPRRGDLDMEWDNEAEKTISEMEFTSEDTKADRELKLDVIRIFNAKLDEREKRKKFIISQGLLNYRENQEKMWRMEPDERHLVQRMRLFARYHTKEEHEAFVNKIIEAKRLRKEIAKMQMYRRIGITSLAEVEKYEVDKLRREEHIDAWKKKEEEKKKAAEDAIRATREDAVGLGLVSPTAPITTNEAKVAVSNQSLQVWKQFKTTDKKKDSNEDAASKANKFVIKDEPGYALLSKKEVGLCKRLRLLPKDYLNVKKALISESLTQGLWKPTSGVGQKKSIFKIDINQRDSILDFVVEAGWISKN